MFVLSPGRGGLLRPDERSVLHDEDQGMAHFLCMVGMEELPLSEVLPTIYSD